MTAAAGESVAPQQVLAPRPCPAPAAEVIAFLNLEARLADEAAYSQWESLWDDDGRYWVPMHPGDDPGTHLSYIYDNRRRIKSRVAQLNSGARHSQTPPSVMRRMLANHEVVDTTADTVTVGSNFVLYEHRGETTIWAGRYLHTVRTHGNELRLAAKTVHLVNAGDALPTLAFLL